MTENPFQILESRLANIESLILDFKHQQVPVTKEPKLLSVKEAAQFLRLSEQTVYTKVSRQEIPFHKKGNRLYFISEELMMYASDDSKSNSVGIEAEEFLANLKLKRNGRKK